MRTPRIRLPLALLAAFVMLAVVATASHGSRNAVDESLLRPTNIELRILSQSCFQGEIVPCG